MNSCSLLIFVAPYCFPNNTRPHLGLRVTSGKLNRERCQPLWYGIIIPEAVFLFTPSRAELQGPSFQYSSTFRLYSDIGSRRQYAMYMSPNLKLCLLVRLQPDFILIAGHMVSNHQGDGIFSCDIYCSFLGVNHQIR